MTHNMRIPMFIRSLNKHSNPRQLHTSVSHSQSSSDDNNDIDTNFVNANPRSMEMLRLQKKPKGWHLDSPSYNFWYKLILESTSRHVSGQVVHYTGRTVVSASTKEWAIKRQLYSSNDVSAYENIGSILAHRCLQSGITEIHTDLSIVGEESEKISSFLKALESGGVKTEEPEVIAEHFFYPWSKIKPGLPWDVREDDLSENTKKE